MMRKVEIVDAGDTNFPRATAREDKIDVSEQNDQTLGYEGSDRCC